jgi:hypothetical protein
MYPSIVLHASGNTCVPGLDAKLAAGLREDVITLFGIDVVAGAWCCGHICWQKQKAVVEPVWRRGREVHTESLRRSKLVGVKDSRADSEILR